jgi:hypothetical protein
MSKFESIFASSSNVDSNLNSLFKKKKADENAAPIINMDDSESDQENEKEEEIKSQIKKVTKSKDGIVKADKKLKAFDLEKEKRTIFIGNLNADCKKNVKKLCYSFRD